MMLLESLFTINMMTIKLTSLEIVNDASRVIIYYKHDDHQIDKPRNSK
jgi:hypothetical protein